MLWSVRSFPQFLTVFVDRIPGGAVVFIPARPVYLTASVSTDLLSLQQFVPSFCDGAAHDYWGHLPCSRRRRHLLTKCTRTCCDIVFETFINICLITVCSDTIASGDLKAYSTTRLRLIYAPCLHMEYSF